MHPRRLFIVPDSPYTDIIIRKCELVAPGENDYVAISAAKVLKYVKSNLVHQVHYQLLKGWQHTDFLNNATYKAVYINLNGVSVAHFFRTEVRPRNKAAKLVCMFWSAELYNHPQFTGDLYDAHAAPFAGGKRKLLQNGWFDGLLGLLRMPNLKGLTSVNRDFDYFCALLPQEHQLFRETFQSKARFLRFLLLDTDTFLDPGTEQLPKDKLLLGNSGAIENNHFEALQVLAQSGVSIPVVCPLNYGNMAYAAEVAAEGNRLLGTHFQPLRDFLPLADYNRILSTIRVAVFNQYIQQAFGNIVSLLYHGARIYLNPKNPLYKGLLEIGFYVNSITEFKNFGEKELDTAQQATNKALIDQLLSPAQSTRYYQDLMDLANEA